jgi:hypothetical protein
MFPQIQIQYPAYTSPRLPISQPGNQLCMRLCKEARSSHTRSQRRTRVLSDKANKASRQDGIRGSLGSNLHTRRSNTSRTNIFRVDKLYSQAPMVSLCITLMPKTKRSSRDSTVCQPNQLPSLLLRTNTLPKISLPTRSPISNSNKISGSRLPRPSKLTHSSRPTHTLPTVHNSRHGNQDISFKGRLLDHNMPK